MVFNASLLLTKIMYSIYSFNQTFKQHSHQRLSTVPRKMIAIVLDNRNYLYSRHSSLPEKKT